MAKIYRMDNYVDEDGRFVQHRVTMDKKHQEFAGNTAEEIELPDKRKITRPLVFPIKATHIRDAFKQFEKTRQKWAVKLKKETIEEYHKQMKAQQEYQQQLMQKVVAPPEKKIIM